VSPPLAARPTIWTHVPDSGGLLIHHHHIFSETDTACTHTKSGMVAYQGGVLTVGVGIVIFYVSQISRQTYI